MGTAAEDDHAVAFRDGEAGGVVGVNAEGYAACPEEIGLDVHVEVVEEGVGLKRMQACGDDGHPAGFLGYVALAEILGGAVGGVADFLCGGPDPLAHLVGGGGAGDVVQDAGDGGHRDAGHFGDFFQGHFIITTQTFSQL